jgi:hypothetical protein
VKECGRESPALHVERERGFFRRHLGVAHPACDVLGPKLLQKGQLSLPFGRAPNPEGPMQSAAMPFTVGDATVFPSSQENGWKWATFGLK